KDDQSTCSGLPLREPFAKSSSCFSLILSAISREAPLSFDLGVSPRLALSAAPAAFCWALDLAGISRLLPAPPLPVNDRPAVGMQHLTRHIAAVIAGQEQEGRRDFIGLARPFHGCAFAEMRNLFGRSAAARVERRPDRPRGNRIHADALVHKIFAQGP